ncbi:sulfite exporter TauE/SafE family protein [Aestuariibacter sp. AA17]|uniref:Probable membrane transporter protein n=1 Tax=Fluctibacter corallii TaxID=2984329 RepID=A0ABT3A7Q9_9ALTE|nr:sulfite exporter TauE/SafE family protein [Aestuariibacter sp. AA17]MCV2884638.1 sulfite exporter TauE/SafE family protein [Aestuariibacter sp. AA17]
MSIFIICLFLGAVVGVLAGMLGIGGGIVIVPVLLYLFTQELMLPLSVAMPMAVATSLSTIILTGMSSSRAHYRYGNLDMTIVKWCALGISLGAVVGAQIASQISGEALKNIFAYLLALIALQMAFGGRRTSKHDMSPKILTSIGFITGNISAFMGIGGGALMVPALVWFRVNVKLAIGCAAFCGLVIAVFGTASYIVAGWNQPELPSHAVGYVYLPATLGIILTSTFTATLGARISNALDTHLLKKIFAGFLVIVSLRMLLG